VAKHAKNEDYNQKPFDPTLEPAQKGKEFDEQYQQNRSYSSTPNADQVVEKPKGRHAR